MANYNFVVDSSFNPFNMQEMLVPFSAYKDAFEKSEEQYDTLSQGADKFKYLSDTLPEGSKARQIYEGYANDLRAQAEDLAHNGLTMGNRRALTSLKRRYQGEMGRILQADEAMREEKKLRQSLGAQDTSLLYANDNLNIDDFLDGNTPNLYRISGNELYTRGAAAGKAASSRIINIGEGNITLGGYYRDLVSKYGYSPELLNKFRQDINSIPELKAAFDATMEERGVTQNLTGYNRRRAEQSFINGVIDGAVYQENHSPQRDLGVLTPMEQNQVDMQQRQFNLSKVQLDARAASMGYRVDDNGNLVVDPDRMKALKELKKSGKNNTNDSLDDGYTTKNKKSIKLTWKGNNPDDINGKADDDYTIKEMEDGESLPGQAVKFDELPSFVQERVKRVIGGGKTKLYRYFYQPFERGWGQIGGNSSIGDDTETEIAIVPADVVKFNKNPNLDFGLVDPNSTSK